VRRKVALLAVALAFGAIGGYLWLAMWADERRHEPKGARIG